MQGQKRVWSCLLWWWWASGWLSFWSEAVSAVKEPATGVDFPEKKNGLKLLGVGVRRKGPFAIYAVALHGPAALHAHLAKVSRKEEKGKRALTTLQQRVKESSTILSLTMVYGVSASTMASGIAEAVGPRFTGGKTHHLEALKDLIIQGVQDKDSKSKSPPSAVKGTTFQFDCSPSGVTVTVNGRLQGTIRSPPLAKALIDVYLDDKSVSPSLRKSCVERCCAP